MRVTIARLVLLSGVMTVAFAGSAVPFRQSGPVRPAPPALNALSSWPQLNPIGLAKLPGSFVSPRAIYADSERIYACSYQGDLFILKRDRKEHFPWIQTIRLGSPLTAVHGDEEHLYLTGRDGNLHVLTKSWPVRIVKSIALSEYGLGAVHVAGENVFVAKGQASMTASERYVYLSSLNPGDSGLEVLTRRSYGEEEFEPGKTLVFDRQSLRLAGAIPTRHSSAIHISTWRDFVYLTTPGCCGPGIDIYNATTLERVQSIKRSTNTVAGMQKNGISVLVGGSETGAVDWYVLGSKGYQLAGSVELRRWAGFTGPEDIEIRSLWADGLDGLVFAGSSWGNDQTRSPNLPSLFVLEIL